MSSCDWVSMGDKTAPLEPPFSASPLPQSHTTTLTPSPTSSHHVATHGSPQIITDTTPLSPLDSLPTIAGRGPSTFFANNDIAAFLEEDLDLSRLNRIHTHLWMAGRPMRARPLHRYKMYGYEILGTQQMDLHLLRFSNKLLLKPLPEYLLDPNFWRQHLCSPTDTLLRPSATGWLLSYVWLLTTPLDLKLAHDLFLLPAGITWTSWKSLATEFLKTVDINAPSPSVNKRFVFGDLRLSRVNFIYRTRFFRTHFVRGYLYGYNRYVVFFERNFSWILIVVVFLGLVLSAMQVGTGLEALSGNRAFVEACRVTVVLSMVGVAGVLGAVSVVFAGVFAFNMVMAVAHARRVERGRMRIRGKGV